MQKISYIMLSFLVGSVLQLLATSVFWLVACGPRTRLMPVNKVLNCFYGAELLKWLIVVAGFSGIWAWGCWDPLAVLVGFFVPQLIYWKLLFSRKLEKLCLTRKPAA
jgi:F0F1-type ATP synthase assembly protein I